MFGFLNPFRRMQEKKRARMLAEKDVADRMVERAEAEREAKRRQDYADHLAELKAAVKQPRVKLVSKSDSSSRSYQPTYSTSESVTDLLNSISEQSRVTAFEQSLPDTSSNGCSGESGSSSDSGCSSSSSD